MDLRRTRGLWLRLKLTCLSPCPFFLLAPLIPSTLSRPRALPGIKAMRRELVTNWEVAWGLGKEDSVHRG